MNHLALKQRLTAFFNEDIGSGDKTCEALFHDHYQVGKGTFTAKQNGVFAGEKILQEAYSLYDPHIKVNLYKRDGDIVQKGDVIAEVTGMYHHLLTSERVILNVIQRMSGIATMTNRAVKALDNDRIRVVDTRKTTPGLRMIEKYAVRCGGGFNHRFGLDDAIMLKDNHIAAVGSIEAAVKKVREVSGHMVKIEVEIEQEQQLEEAINAGVDVIMFDNMSPDQINRLMDQVPTHILTEASGNITVENIHQYKETRIDMISLGFLTHSAPGLDISFNLTEGTK
ncbi:carboxylating nicotinate-nucleotide diphosphorylase [Gracilibacillus kekensis]|uniref:Probable nicotinate-nucleotide pyrophosphorylase [carboxylating] n=1 Tax=Gracilibacillus kekensis TaxID=1027249 RepID=A0A1M7NYA4_9BACI|nr:carboxylating nicotinate-nucleotide diphosphorylase [Gracilibacillus kekensis]SHN09046.1 nicotinate-nucleotide pyrophosphorylase [carboxylating] [Gracilibacillus kekensis]